MLELPPGIEINNLIDNLRIISWEASEVLLHYSKILKESNYESNILENNDNENPVTTADLEVNKIIIERINEKYKGLDWEILSEENVKFDSENCMVDADWLWVLDPLDGTKDFIQGTGNYAMHLALNYKKTLFMGIVLIPEKNELWFGYGKNVWCEKKDGSKLKLYKNKSKTLRDMVIVTSKNHRNEKLKNLIQKINFKKVSIMGSIGCKIASLIRGESDIYICLSVPGSSSPKDWDFAAPAAILKAAGGAITNLENKELTFGNCNFEQGGIIIATNNAFNHCDICTEVKDIIEKNNIFPF